ncbi:hypothetical protein A2U01_0075581, partial [Trifolium medium]|nr:hypothetical protein [Trifolium medium]
GADNSGEDEESGNEGDKEVATNTLHGERNEDIGGRPLLAHESKGREVFLTCEKSTNLSNSQMEILSVDNGFAGNKETVIRQGEKEKLLAVSTKEV